jgi:type IV secretion system protein VirB9
VHTRNIGVASLSKSRLMHPVLLVCMLALSGCATFKPPQISYDDDVTPLPNPTSPGEDRPRSLHVPPSWAPSKEARRE